MSLRELRHTIKSFVFHQRTTQIGSLYSAMVISIAMGFVTSIINTRTLGPEGYGDFKFINNVFYFLGVVSGFGLFVTGAQLIALIQRDEKHKSELAGALIVVAGIISAIFTVISIVFAFVEPQIFHNDLSLTMLIFSPTVAIVVAEACIMAILQGDNRIHEMSFFKVLPNAAFTLLLLGMVAIVPLNVTLTLTLQFIGTGAMTYVFVRRLKPSYSNVSSSWREIWRANKQYGRHVYVGSLSGVATSYLSTFMISYYLDNTNVGFFALAQTLSMPLMQVTSVVGTTYFKEFAHSNYLPKKVTLASIGLAGVTLLVFVGLINPLVLFLYTEKFMKVAALASIIAFGTTIHGIGDYVNRFLGAHGRGKDLRNGAIAVGVVHVLGYGLLIRFLGVDGAAITRLCSGATYCAMMVAYYIRFRRSLKLQGVGVAVSEIPVYQPVEE